MNWSNSLVQIAVVCVSAGLLYGGVELIPIDKAKLKRWLGAAILIGAALWLMWRFLGPGLG